MPDQQNKLKTVRFLGVDILPIGLDSALAKIKAHSGRDEFSYVVTPNVDHFVNLYPKNVEARHEKFRAAYDDAAMVLCDSRIVRFLAKISGVNLSVVPGSDLTAALFSSQLSSDDSVAIIGGTANLLETLSARYPEPIYFHHIPPMGVLNNSEAISDIINFLAETKADYALFAIGAPQSEIVAHQCAQDARCRGVGLCIGASLEFITADKKRAPPWMQKAGLEWAFRLASEPRRLWRRYLVEGPRIFLIYLQHRRADN